MEDTWSSRAEKLTVPVSKVHGEFTHVLLHLLESRKKLLMQGRGDVLGDQITGQLNPPD